MWLSLGDFSERRGGAFCINNVTGPDEYTAVVDNNRFTNMMARENLRAAVRAVNFVRQSHRADFERLVERTRLDLKEMDRSYEQECWRFSGAPQKLDRNDRNETRNDSKRRAFTDRNSPEYSNKNQPADQRHGLRQPVKSDYFSQLENLFSS